MNFRTTILLFVVLVAAAALYFVSSRDPGNSGEQTQSDRDTSQAGKKLIDVAAADVNKIVVAPASGQRVALERSGAAEWRMTEPVNAPAEAFRADDLVREVLDLHTTGREDAAGKGLDAPTYVIELTDKNNKVTKLNVGTHSPVGDILYVRLDGQDQADVVSGSIVAQLEKKASEYRKLRLLPQVQNDQITGVTVAHDGQTLKLSKGAGEKWQVLEPKQVPGDTGQISALLSAITGLDAVKFVAEDAKDAARYGLTKPQMTVSFTTAPASTQPSSTTQPSAADQITTIKFGGPQDVFKKTVYASASDAGPVVTVDAARMDAFKKTPLELRDREVLDVDADAVSRVTITTDKAATTQPTTQPASKQEVVLERRSETPAAAATAPATTQSTTAPAAAPKSKWLVASEPKADASDTAVQDLLAALYPLRVETFLESLPTTQATPVATYALKVSTRAWADEPAKEHELKLTDRGGTEKLLGRLGDLTFELDRSILEKLTADFAAPKVAPAGPTFGPPTLPGLPGIPGLPGVPTPTPPPPAQ